MYDVMAVELKIPLIFVSSDLYWYIELSSLPAYDWSTTFCRSDAADKQHNIDTAMQRKITPTMKIIVFKKGESPSFHTEMNRYAAPTVFVRSFVV